MSAELRGRHKPSTVGSDYRAEELFLPHKGPETQMDSAEDDRVPTELKRWDNFRRGRR